MFYSLAQYEAWRWSNKSVYYYYYQTYNNLRNWLIVVIVTFVQFKLHSSALCKNLIYIMEPGFTLCLESIMEPGFILFHFIFISSPINQSINYTV